MIDNFASYISDKTENYTIFDIGARDCLQSIEFYNKFPNAKIYAFECNPNTIDICKKNIENYKDRITLIEGAVCDYDGFITFYPINQQKTETTWKDGNPGASSLFKSNGNYTVERYVQDEITTNCHRLDTIMKNNNIQNVDLIWMDLQGAELLAFKGLGECIQNVKFIHTEVTYTEMYSGQVMFNEFNEFMMSNDFILKNKLSNTGWQEDAIYENKKHSLENIFGASLSVSVGERLNSGMSVDEFDVVIPIGPNDIQIANQQIEYTKLNVIGYRNIYLISYDDSVNIEGCITVSEKIFPFSIETVSKYHGKLDRNGWYLQQLLKLYAGLVIPDILDKYLVIDTDTFFTKPTIFYENGKSLYNYGTEYHEAYFNHMNKLHPALIRMEKPTSGICHHMLFETKYIKELFTIVKNNHNKELFYDIFLKYVDESDYDGAGASEYEIYFNFILCAHPNEIILRPLKWKNTDNLDELNNDNYDYISYHWYLR